MVFFLNTMPLVQQVRRSDYTEQRKHQLLRYFLYIANSFPKVKLTTTHFLFKRRPTRELETELEFSLGVAACVHAYLQFAV